MTSLAETIHWSVETRIDKWHDEADHLAGLEPDEVYHGIGNMLMNRSAARRQTGRGPNGRPTSARPTPAR
jgi:hypothetical protein